MHCGGCGQVEWGDALSGVGDEEEEEGEQQLERRSRQTGKSIGVVHDYSGEDKGQEEGRRSGGHGGHRTRTAGTTTEDTPA